MSFQNKVVIITGEGTGIGKEIARRFLAQGASVVINSRREDVLKQTAEELDPAGKRLAIAAGDIGPTQNIRSIDQTAVEQFGGVDILVNNAGIFKPTPFLDHGEADFDAYVNVILRGTFSPRNPRFPKCVSEVAAQLSMSVRCGRLKPSGRRLRARLPPLRPVCMR